MKQGSADDPFADDREPEPADDGREAPDRSAGPETTAGTDAPTESTTRSRTQRQSLPFIHARDGVKDERTQRPVFLRDHVEDGIDDLVGQMEDEFDQTVYKTDVTEAAMVVAQENPELLFAVLEEWEYDWS